MKTFFLNEGTSLKTRFLTESEVNMNVLLFENATLESEVAYQDIMQEAILSEAQMLLEADGEEKKKGNFKETLANFFKKMVEWFSNIMIQVGKFMNNTVQALATKLTGAKKKFKTHRVVDDPKAKFTVKFNYPSLTPQKLASLVSDYKAHINNPTEDSAFEKTVKEITAEKAKRVEYTDSEVRIFVIYAESLVDMVKKTGRDALKEAKEGLKEAKEGLKEAKKEKADEAKLKAFKDSITVISSKVKSINKANSSAIRIGNHITNVFLRKFFGEKKDAETMEREKKFNIW